MPFAAASYVNTLDGAGVLAGGSQVVGGHRPPRAPSACTLNRTADIAGRGYSVLTRGVGNVVTYDDQRVLDGTEDQRNTGGTDSAS